VSRQPQRTSGSQQSPLRIKRPSTDSRRSVPAQQGASESKRSRSRTNRNATARKKQESDNKNSKESSRRRRR
jgi:hypothetical protein